METRFQTSSFIPRSNLANVVNENGEIQNSNNNEPGSLFFLFGFLIFLISVISAGIFTAIESTANKSIEANIISLNKVSNSINKDKIISIKRSAERFKYIDLLLLNHVAVSRVFDELSRVTLKDVSVTDFQLKDKGNGFYILNMKAKGRGYESLVGQDRIYANDKSFFKNTTMPNFSKAKGDALVDFDINTNINKSDVNFEKLLKK